MNNYNYIIQAFTRDGNNTNLEVNNLDVGCITSANNNFDLDSNGNLTVNSLTANSIVSQSLTNAMYPVGSVYMSVNSTSPSILFGGQWEQLKDRFLLGCGDVYQNNTTGGEAEHVLTVDEMPAHGHNFAGNADLSAAPYAGNGTARWPIRYISSSQQSSYVKSRGGSEAHNNMPPYLTVYIWKRIS